MEDGNLVARQVTRAEVEFPSAETLATLDALDIHQARFSPEFLEYAKRCICDRKYREESIHCHRIARPWKEWYANTLYHETKQAVLLRRPQCQPPQGYSCEEMREEHLVLHHSAYWCWGAEIAYIHLVQPVCRGHHDLFHFAQCEYAWLMSAIRDQLRGALDDYGFPNMAWLITRRDALRAQFAIQELPYALQCQVEQAEEPEI